jgi:PAS domain S-box-containing protein
MDFMLHQHIRILIASFLPFLAAFVQWQLWPFLPPLTWLFLYPAIFFSARIGGLVGGLIATVFSMLLGVYLFMPPQMSWEIADFRHILSVIIFGVMGTLFSVFHARLHKTLSELTRINALNLESAQAKLTLALEAANAGIWEWNLQNNQNVWSDGIYQLYGLQKQQVKPSYEAWLEAVHPDDRENLVGKLKQAVQNASEMILEWRVANCSPDQERWLMSSGKPLLNAQGVPELYRGIVIDISQRKRSEQALTESEFRLNFALETLRVGAWDLDLNTRKVHRSRLHDQIFGHAIPLDNWTVETFMEHIVPEDRAMVEQSLKDASNQLNESDVEFRIKRPDGEVRWVWARGRHQVNDQGHPVRFGGVVLDIQDRKNTEFAIKNIGEQLLETQHLAGLGSWQWDLNTNIQTWSEETYRLYGLEPSSSPPSYPGIKSFFTEQSWALLSGQVEQALANGTAYECDLELIRASGEHCWVTARGATIRDANGVVVKLHGTLQDITERKRSEITLQISEQRFRRLFQDAPIARALVSRDGVMLNTNERFEQLFGYSTTDISSLSNWWLLAYPDPAYRNEVMTSWEKAEAYAKQMGTSIPEQEYRITCRNGEIRDVIFSCIVIGTEYMVSFVDVTEQKKAEALLHEHERLLADSQAVAHIGSWKLNFKTGQIIWSQETFKLFGLSSENTPPPNLDGFKELICPEQRLTLKSWLDSMMAKADPYPIELKTCAIDGQFRWLLLIGKPDWNASGELINIIGTLQDITERKQLEDERLQLEARYRALFDQATPDAIFVHDHSGKLIEVNHKACESTGFSKQELLRMNVLDLEMDFDLPLAQAAWSQIDPGVTKIIYGRHCRKDGRLFPVEINFGILEDKDQRLYIALVRDITARVKTEEKLILQSKALEAAANAIMITDRTGKIEWVNPQFSQMTGYSLAESIDKNTDELFKCHIRHPEIHQKVWATISNGEIWQGEIEYTRKDGTEYPEEQTITPVFDEGGLIQHFIAIKQDITERKRNESELKNYRERLEKLVEARTEDLKIARKEAERLSEVKSVFLANMSHEIRSPMNAVLGYCYLLGLLPLEDESRELVKKIHNAGTTLMAIINDILDFSKIEAGRIEIEQVPFSLPGMIEQLADLMTSVATGKNLELIIVPPPVSLDRLIGDGLRLQQVLINLLSNAIKFTDKGDVIFSINIEEETDDYIQLRFFVRDTGIGISQLQQRTIFSAFSQADSSITRRFGGSGLGLSISHQLVQLMGGSLQVTSHSGLGSEFWFVLPLRIDTSEPATVLQLSHLDLLVADDCETARESIVNTAKSLGWTANSVDSGLTALKQTEASWQAEKPYDVLILDWKMPEMDGLSTAQAVKESLACPNGQKKMPIVIMVSAYSREELMAQPGMVWVDAVLSKPVTPSSLYNAIAHAMNDREHLLAKDAGMMHSVPERHRLAGLRVLAVDDSEFNQEVIKGILEAEGATVFLAEDGQEAVDWLI